MTDDIVTAECGCTYSHDGIRLKRCSFRGGRNPSETAFADHTAKHDRGRLERYRSRNAESMRAASDGITRGKR